MTPNGYYSTGEFMKLAHITKKTIRYYDEHDILKPSYVDLATRSRFYTDDDLARLQQILLLKALGFSLSDIKELTIRDADSHFMADSLTLQLKLIEDRIEQLQVVAQTIQETTQLIKEEKSVNWSHMLDLIHNLGMEKSMMNQYQNASNISARINLHALYSRNRQGWFPWIFDHCNFYDGMKVLEIGCGEGSFWSQNSTKLPANMNVTLSDISAGMLRDARRTLGKHAGIYHYQVFDCANIPYKNDTFDLILANHVLFYCEDIPKVCAEIRRTLKPNGLFLCSAYGSEHMKEINKLVSDFDDRIVLSAEKLYERFGKENGMEILSPFFSSIQWQAYEDSLEVPAAEPLISYVLSCHGNQNQYILDHYNEFRTFVKNRVQNKFHISKDAGIFLCK